MGDLAWDFIRQQFWNWRECDKCWSVVCISDSEFFYVLYDTVILSERPYSHHNICIKILLGLDFTVMRNLIILRGVIDK